MNDISTDKLSIDELKQLAIILKKMCTDIEKEHKQVQEKMQELNKLSALLKMEE